MARSSDLVVPLCGLLLMRGGARMLDATSPMRASTSPGLMGGALREGRTGALSQAACCAVHATSTFRSMARS
eukprot:CAMPEP_0173381864 /NCGR_PEP_ID=MMETSP1356-20130122/4307_1 /TAXON_ID=77927 ORGANISM="Hemiselmis virescens, Strain PCC157" /NCGR_SAMPLE_ID=MMETSP1356 /ASSEMBLY_ACC=CAM_ASM_000847 /LENGTH=71 /DNA_ID=CAMNT_0014335909 /DNA_START=79 /DNA_END=291 /DNA_ORIENTATION=+